MLYFGVFFYVYMLLLVLQSQILFTNIKIISLHNNHDRTDDILSRNLYI